VTASNLPSAAGIAAVLNLPEDEVHKLSLAAKLGRVRRAAGLCPDCGGQPVPRRVKCRACLDLNLAYVKQRQQALVAEGKCRRCGEPADPGKTQCKYHLEMYRKNSKRLRAR
jgi:hypothetical protein